MQPSRRHPTPPAAPSDDRPAGSEAGGSGNATAVPGDPPLPTAMLSDRILASFTTRPQLLPAFFDMLCNDIGTQLAAMQSAHDAGDPVALRHAAHAAKGVAQG
ncbi:MAG TPA: Hpt domain-containing protein, partial [Desulfuromonadaceae bacterium]